MNELTWISVILTFIFPHLYGVVENRLFKESGNTIPGGHFKWYHVYLFGLFGGNATIAWALTNNPIFGLFILVYSPLALDWVWWTIRYYDFKTDPLAPDRYNGETNAWHEQGDWDNYGGFKIDVCYLWWKVFGVISFILFIASVILSYYPVILII